MLTLCLDIGGTKIAAGLADSEGSLAYTATRPTPAGGSAEQVWAVVSAMIAEALAAADGAVRAVGIASAGPIDLHSGTVSQPDQHRGLAGVYATGPCRRRGARLAGTTGRRRRMHGTRRALA